MAYHPPMLEDVYGGFRDRYLDYDELTAQVKAWAERYPEVVRTSSIGTTDEGREMWLLEIGPEPDRLRPAVWVDGNMHACELCGSSVALSIAEDVIRLHAGEPSDDLPPTIADRLREVLFYVLPRMSPDGAETVLKTGRYVRSSPRDERPNTQHPRWRGGDVDGDGLALAMRVEDPAGEYVESAEVPGLMLLRRLEDAGPYYKVYPEGTIDNFDGHSVPNPSFLSDNATDLNRNFPFSWMPEGHQMGAGSFPMSAPESRAVVEYTSARPHIFAWLNLHTFGGCYIRPLGDKPDNKMDPEDLALFRQIGTWAEDITGYPMVSGFEEFTYEPDKPLHGDLVDYAYYQRGCISYVIELWDLFRQIGMDKKKRFVDHYTQMSRDDLISFGRWDKDNNEGRVIGTWRPFDHSQLGPVELGGLAPVVGLWNPPYDQIAEVCERHSAAFLLVAAMSPAVRVAATEVSRGDDGVARVAVTVRNEGYLPTYILSSSKALEHNEPLYIDAVADGCELVDAPRDAHRQIGHLDGWGRGMFDGTSSLFYVSGRGNTAEATVSYAVRGSGTLKLRVGSCRTGWIDELVEV